MPPDGGGTGAGRAAAAAGWVERLPGAGLTVAYLSFIALSCADALVKSLGGLIPVFEILLFSSGAAFLVMWLLPPKGERRRDLFRVRLPWLVAARAGCVIVMGLCSIYAFTTIPLAEVYAFIFLSPAYIVLFSIVLLREPVTRRQLAAVAVGFVGVLLVVRPGFRELHLGHLAAAITPLGGALNVIILRRARGVERGSSLMAIPMLAATLVAACFSVAEFRMPQLHELGRLLACGAFVAAGQTGIMVALRTSTAARIGAAHYSQMIWAIVFGTLFFAEFPDALSLAGMAAIAGSGLILLTARREG